MKIFVPETRCVFSKTWRFIRKTWRVLRKTRHVLAETYHSSLFTFHFYPGASGVSNFIPAHVRIKDRTEMTV